jgi:hypothetical protein
MKHKDSCILIHIYLCLNTLANVQVEYLYVMRKLTIRTSKEHINYIFGLTKCVVTEIPLIHLVTQQRLFSNLIYKFTVSKNYRQNK